MQSNLRHLRVFVAVHDTRSITRAANRCHVTQPAVTQAINKLEEQVGRPLFVRSSRGIFPTETGDILASRVERAFAILDPALSDIAPRLKVTATIAQLKALISLREAESSSLAARRLGLAQPTVHRAIRQLEHEAGRALFERTSLGMIATRPAEALAQAAQLAFAELEQADADLAELDGRETGRIVVGAMPLSRAYLMARTIQLFRQSRPRLPIKALDGPYDDLIAGLRRGEVDFLIGALRNQPHTGDLDQKTLFNDSLIMLTRPDHPLAGNRRVGWKELARYPFVVAIEGTPTRITFDRLFEQAGVSPESLIETGSMILMRELLRNSDHIGCLSRLQAESEIGLGAIKALDIELDETARPIGLTLRKGWVPTAAQREFLDRLDQVVTELHLPRA